MSENGTIPGHGPGSVPLDGATVRDPSDPDRPEGSDDHLALIYEERDEQFATVVPFVREGIERGERCLYIADDNTKAAVRDALREAGIDVAAARDSGALSIHTTAEAEFGAGGFDAEVWRSFLEQAREDDGFDGVRVASEMTWVLEEGTGLDDLERCETLLDAVDADGASTLLCQYNRDRFPPEAISDVLRSHPVVVHDGTACRNVHHRPPDTVDPDGGRRFDTGEGTGTPRLDPGSASGRGDPDARPVRVLYVDDEPDYANVAAEFLELEDGIDAVIPETSPGAVTDRLAEEPIDCVVSDYEMPELDGLELFESVRAEHPTLPFILVTGKGDEVIAGEAVSAGVTDYLRKHECTYTVLANRITNAVEQYRTEREIRRTQRRYGRLIEESTDVITIVDEDGRFEYLSPAAERRLGYPAEELVGEACFDYVHPEDRAWAIEQFEKLIDRPTGRLSLEFRFEQPDGSWTWLQARGRNLLDDPDVKGVVVYARDVTGRKERERALRESEQRFRSLFEKSFDAMVLADDDGQCTDANPAACELFELSREELLGRSIAEFVPEECDLDPARWGFRDPDPDRGTFPLVGAAGTERVVEFAATPNVVPGRHLSVLRDVTEREQYERTLTALHASSRDLVEAESKAAVAESVAGTATEILSMSIVAVYLFDTAEGLLKPSAVHADAADGRTLDPLPPDRDTPIGSVFLDGESRRIGDAETEAERTPPLRDLSLHDGVLFPLGDHGVCVIGNTGSDVTGLDRELAEILIKGAETALDRVAREAELREQRTELREQNRRLERLNRLNETIGGIDETLLQADSRNGIETAVCEHLSACSGVDSVWIGAPDPRGEILVSRAWDGSDGTSRYLDAVPLALDADGSEPAVRAALSREPVHVANVADGIRGGTWRREALSTGFRSAFSVPLTYKDIFYGVLTVYAERPAFFDDLIRVALVDLGNKVSNAINAVEHQNAVLSERTTEVRVRLADERVPLYAIASRAGCSLDLETITQRPDGDVLKRVRVEGADPSDVTDIARERTAIADASTVNDGGREDLVELRYSGRFLTGTLADRGVRVPAFTADAESATVTFLVPDTVDTDWVFEQLRARCSDPELVAKSRRDGPDTATERRTVERYRSKLTPRQQEVLRTAYHEGFFRTPRECTGEDIAERLDIAPQTFYSHIRAAERKLFETVFD